MSERGFEGAGEDYFGDENSPHKGDVICCLGVDESWSLRITCRWRNGVFSGRFSFYTGLFGDLASHDLRSFLGVSGVGSRRNTPGSAVTAPVVSLCLALAVVQKCKSVSSQKYFPTTLVKQCA